MNESRLNRLLEFLKQEPNDPFLIYGIATEYLAEAPLKAREYFEKLLKEHPDYIATYYHAAHLYIDLGEVELAKTTFEKGIEFAKDRDAKAHRELQTAYNNWLFDMD